MNKRFWLLLAALLCLMIPAARAQVRWEGADGLVWTESVSIGQEEWLFLPSGTNLSALSLDGETVDWLAAPRVEEDARESKAGEALPGVYTRLWKGRPLRVAVSENVRSVHLFSQDPQNYGRAWLEDCELHQRKTTGRVTVLRADGSVSLDAPLRSLRGRGNTTWQKAEHKKPYQFKLEYKADLLETGLAYERSRTWVLLSSELEPTLLQNRIALDLGRAMGLRATSRCETVDLFYDGDYRGAYLLAEKVEVGEHSVDVRDFDKLLSPVNDLLGVTPPGDLPSPTNLGTVPPQADGQNAHGLDYGYAEGVYDNQQVDAGGYLLELDGMGTLSDHTWFSLPWGRYVAVKSPEYAGDTMMRYISDAFLTLCEALMNYGYHPQTGQSVEELLDVDSYVRSHLVQELLLSNDGYLWASTYFVLPEGETRFQAGPVWDFDRMLIDQCESLKEDNPFSSAFYRTTVMQRAAKEIWAQTVRPLYETVLFGNAHTEDLHPFAWYQENVRASWYMDFYRHQAAELGVLHMDSRFDQAMDELETFLRRQYEFLDTEIHAWGEDVPTDFVRLSFAYPYGNVQDEDNARLEDEPHGSLLLTGVEMTVLRPATVDTDALWQVDFTIEPKPRCRAAELVTVEVNGEPYQVEPAEDGTLRLSFTFEDPSYRPAVLDGVDYGYVYRYEDYVETYPELLDEYGDDREAVLRYFVEVGIDQGDVANAFFDPMQVFDISSRDAERFGQEWRKYYERFLQYPGLWMEQLENVYEPELMPVE